ncbi:MAG TPA: choice-of-anchor D domain-containing protein [Ktedonobacteraceae bacterium]|nr:choice-of-anchor D domain-containing protein [Ktedonobacteraceae bacterium]
METKRCQRCHKLLRVDAQICSRCGGHDFLQVTHARNKHTGVLASNETVSLHSNPPPSPPSSPHRAGHYSGLHPEDQPYQSSFLPVQHPLVQAKPALEVEEAEDLPFSTAPDVSFASAPVAVPKRQVASLSPLPQPRPQRSALTMQPPLIEQDETERDLEAAYLPAPAAYVADPRPLTITTRPPRHKKQRYLLSVLLITSCLLFLVATGILAFLLYNSKPIPLLKPKLLAEPAGPLSAPATVSLSGSGFQAEALVAITHDANIPVQDARGNPLQVRTFSTGNFSAQIFIPGSWAAGNHFIYATDKENHRASTTITIRPATQPTPTTAPLLKLAKSTIDLGADSAGAVSQKNITLTTTGDGRVSWQGNSDQPWLTLSPTGGTFSGNTAVMITVNRSNLSAQSYTGHISFTQQGSAQPLMLTVTMAVNPASANLALSNSAFTFQGTTGENPVPQPLTIQNTGGQALNWTASIATANSANWLSLSSSTGYLAAGEQATMSVSASSSGLSVGTYQGTLTFSYAGVSSTPVLVTLTVNPQPVPGLAVQPGGLAFNAIQGKNPSSQSFTITNSGTAPLNWGIAEDTNGQLYAPVSLSHGTLAPSKSIAITVSPSISQVSASVLKALITVKDTDSGTPVKSQQVSVTITIVNQAVISLNRNQFTFSNTAAIPSSTQLLTITNTGSAALNWSLTITNSSPVPWLSVDNSSGMLNPGGIDLINVTCDSALLPPGTYTATLTAHDTDTGTPVTSQTVTVTLVVSQ